MSGITYLFSTLWHTNSLTCHVLFPTMVNSLLSYWCSSCCVTCQVPTVSYAITLPFFISHIPTILIVIQYSYFVMCNFSTKLMFLSPTLTHVNSYPVFCLFYLCHTSFPYQDASLFFPHLSHVNSLRSLLSISHLVTCQIPTVSYV